MREIIFDTETTGFRPEDGERVIEIGAIELVNRLETGRTFHEYINPEGREVDPGAFKVHGISNEFLQDKKTFGDIARAFLDFVGDAYLVALDQKTGATIWKTDRPNKTRSYCTPILREIDGKTQMILSGSLSVASYDPDSGEQIWVIDGPTEQFVASLVYHEKAKLLFLTCGFPQKHMLAIRPDGTGNVTKTHVAWRDIEGAAYVPSPVVVGDYFVLVADNGVASCFVVTTGERLWRERLPGGHSASLLSANGLAYFVSDEGIVSVVKPGKTFDVVAQIPLGEKVSASPAVYENHLYYRGEKHLLCIGPKTTITAAIQP